MLRSAYLFCSTEARRAAAQHPSPRIALTHLALFRADFTRDPRDKILEHAPVQPSSKCAALCDDVERLSRGLSTRHRIGSRSIAHRLTQRERELFEAAKRRRFLKMPASGARENLVNVFRLWCQATRSSFDVRYAPHQKFSNLSQALISNDGLKPPSCPASFHDSCQLLRRQPTSFTHGPTSVEMNEFASAKRL